MLKLGRRRSEATAFSPAVLGAAASMVLVIILTAAFPIFHAYALIMAYVAIFVVFWLHHEESAFFGVSLCLVFLFEMNLGLSLSSLKGLSFMNVALFFPLGYLLIKNMKEQGHPVLAGPLNVLFLLLIGYVFLSMMATYLQGKYPLGAPLESNVALYDFDGSLSRLLAEFKRFLNPFLVLLIVTQAPRTKVQVKTLLSLLLAFVGLTVLLSVLGYFGLVPWASYELAEPGGSPVTVTGGYQAGYRLRGITNEPNIYASFLVLFMPLIAASVLYHRKILWKLVFVVLLFFSVLILVLTGSRGGYVGLMTAGLAFGFLLHKKKLARSRRIGSLFAGLTVLLLGVAVFFGEVFRSNVIQRLAFFQTRQLDLASQGRLDLWRQGLEDFLRHPVLGSGWLNSLQVHNNFLFNLATLGLAGFGIYLLIYRKIIVGLLRELKERDLSFENFAVLSFFSGFVGFLFTMFFVEVLVSEFFLYFYLGIILAQFRLQAEDRIPPECLPASGAECPAGRSG